MKANRIYLLLLLVLPAFIIIGFLTTPASQLPTLKDLTQGRSFSIGLEEATSKSIPLSRQLKQLGISLRYITGESLQDGVFISEERLMENYLPNNDDIKNLNTNTLKGLADEALDYDLPIYLAIIPTASAVLQQQLPSYSSITNQRNIIDNIYNHFAGSIATVNVYNALTENSEKYIYYRTEDAPTSLGGYYIYQELIRRMLVEGDIQLLTKFTVSYSNEKYYGPLYKSKPYYKINGDVLAFYNSVENREFSVESKNQGEWEEYRSLYPNQELKGLNHYMGGVSNEVIIYTNPAPDLSLLVIGDNTATSYLPFLTNNYTYIRFINVNNPDVNFDNLSLSSFDQVLIAVDINSYTGSNNLATTLQAIQLTPRN